MSSIAMSVLVTNLFATGKAEIVPFLYSIFRTVCLKSMETNIWRYELSS